MSAAYEVASRVYDLVATMGEALIFAAERVLDEDKFWTVNTICDVGEALAAIERAFSAVRIEEDTTLWQEWSDWLWEVLDRAARACVDEEWEKARDILEGQLLPAFEGWKEETAKIVAPSVFC
ncbi:MAG TPA: hypothetical protein GXX39_01985 [Syntrophothermus lipocalidus]|nr:hypothetical protein [Syntrophothermus lipocalidus]